MATEEFRTMLEKSFQQIEPPESGQIITTTVLQVTDKDVVLDIGAKSEARIDLDEFPNPPQVGEKIEVLVEKSGLNYVQVSYKRAEEKKAFLKVKESAEKATSVEAKVIETVKGGFRVMLEKHINAFLPLSQIEIKRVDNPERYLNQTFQVQVLRFEKKGRNLNIVVSHRRILEEEQKKKTEEFYNIMKVGQEVQCRVLKINPKSVIVEIKGMETAMIRIEDLSWDRINHPKDVVKKGEEIRAKIMNMDKENRKILLSVKDLKENPWKKFAKEYQVGDTVRGEVVKITDRSVFVRVSEGIEGIILFKDLSWSRKIKKPKEVVSANSVVDAKILSMDPDKKRLSLGLKQIEGNPWDNIEEKYPKGKKVKGIVTGKQDFGLFIELEPGIEALLHKNDINWTLKNTDLSQYQPGDTIEGIILKTDPAQKKISIGIKQLFDNPWKNFISENPKGSIVKGKVKEVQEDGVIVEFNKHIEGFLPKNQLAEKTDKLRQLFQVGGEVEAMIWEINPNRNVLKLSIREMVRREREKEVAKYMQKKEEETGVTLGDFIGKNLDMLKNKEQVDEPAENEN